MTGQSSETAANSFGDAIKNLIVSGVRLSAGLTLYSVSQLERVVEAAAGEGALPSATNKFANALDGITASLETSMDGTRKEALRSVSRVARKSVEKLGDVLSPSGALNRKGDGPDPSPVVNPSDTGAMLAVDLLGGSQGS